MLNGDLGMYVLKTHSEKSADPAPLLIQERGKLFGVKKVNVTFCVGENEKER